MLPCIQPCSIVNSSHSKMFSPKFSGHTTSLIVNHLRLLGTLGDPSEPENGQNMPQIIRYCFVHHSSQQCTVFPWKNHPIVKQGLKRKLRTIGDPRGSLGGPSLPEKSKKMLQIIKYSFVHLSSEEKLSISHSEIIP